MAVSTAARQQLRSAAQTWVTEALASLRDLHVIPRPPWDPHARLGENFFSEHLGGVSGAELHEAIRLASDRFTAEDSRLPRDAEVLYSSRLLEACISEVNVRGTAASAHHPELDPIIDEFVEAVFSDEVDVAVCRVVGHLTTEQGRPVRIGQVEVLPVGRTDRSMDARRAVASVIPTASLAVGDAEPWDVSLGDPHSVLVVRQRCPAGIGAESVDTPMRLRTQIDQALLAIDLACGGTAHSVFDISGATSRVTGVPTSRSVAHQPTLPPFWYRSPVTIRATSPIGITAVGDLISATAGEMNRESVHPLRYALHRFVRSKYQPTALDAIAELAISLDSALLERTAVNGKAQRLGNRGSKLIGSATDPADQIKADIVECYKVRNSVTHGDRLEFARLAGKLQAVSTVPAGADSHDVLAYALARFRDLTRRVLLARMVLAAPSRALWPIPASAEDKLAIEAFDSDGGPDDWRAHVRDWMADHYLTSAMEPVELHGPSSA